MGTGEIEAVDAFSGHDQRKENQHDRAGEGRQGVDLAGAEIEARVPGMAAGVVVGERGNGQGGSVTAHVETIGQERHRAEGDPGRDFEDHGHRVIRITIRVRRSPVFLMSWPKV